MVASVAGFMTAPAASAFETPAAFSWLGTDNLLKKGCYGANRIAVSPLGNLYVTSEHGDCLAKYSPTGKRLWLKQLGNNLGGKIEFPAPRGDALVDYELALVSLGDRGVVALDAAGEECWRIRTQEVTVGQSEFKSGDFAANPATHGAYFVRSKWDGQRAWIQLDNIDFYGRNSWSKPFVDKDDRPSLRGGETVVVDPAGNALVAYGVLDRSGTRVDVRTRVLRVSEQGAILQDVAIPGIGMSDAAAVVHANADGGFTLLGYGYAASEEQWAPIALRFDSRGQEVWRTQVGRPSPYAPEILHAFDPAGNLFVHGFVYAAGALDTPSMITLVTPDGRRPWSVDGLPLVRAIAATADGVTAIGVDQRQSYVRRFDLAGAQSVLFNGALGDVPGPTSRNGRNFAGESMESLAVNPITGKLAFAGGAAFGSDHGGKCYSSNGPHHPSSEYSCPRNRFVFGELK